MATSRRPPSRAPHVLVIEPDADARGLLEEFLHHEGYDVLAVSAADEALTALHGGFRPCVVLIDRPASVIAELVRKLAANDDWKEIPVVAMTREPADALAAGARLALQRPVLSARLLATLDQFCTHRRPSVP